jgi:adenylate kinase family enzyme
MEKTEPLIAYYRERGILLQVDAGQDVQGVASEIESKLEMLQW